MKTTLEIARSNIIKRTRGGKRSRGTYWKCVGLFKNTIQKILTYNRSAHWRIINLKIE